MIDLSYPKISVVLQCNLLGLNRSSLYYRPRPEKEYNLQLMRLLDEEYTMHPFYGVLRMTEALKRKGHIVNSKRIRRLLRRMGIEAIYPKPHLSQRANDHKIYPYLLRDLLIDRSDQVWAADITYIRLKHGFIYLVAIMDWFSRYVLSYDFSTTLDSDFCVNALRVSSTVRKPGIFNTDQGSQFTSHAFTNELKEMGIQISMDGRGRALDNIFIERLWRSVKYECVYLHDYETVREAVKDISRYFLFYNHERPHQSLGYRTPEEVYFEAKDSAEVSKKVIPMRR